MSDMAIGAAATPITSPARGATKVEATLVPRQKVLMATVGSDLGAALATIIVWGLKRAGMELPPDVAAAVGTVLIAILTFAAGYATPPGASETSIREGGAVHSAVATT